MQGARLCQLRLERASSLDRGVDLTAIERTTSLRQRLNGIPQEFSQAIQLNANRQRGVR